MFTDPEIAWAGLTAEEAKKKDRMVKIAVDVYPVGRRPVGLLLTVGTDGLTKWIIDPGKRSASSAAASSAPAPVS